jgi:hypothetical protein
MMVLLKPLLQLGMLFVLTSLMCLALIELLPANPLCGLVFFVVSILAILLTVDAV